MNSKGDIIRRINANRNKGYHEKYWDLRTFSNRNIDEENNYSGPLVPPGIYSIHLEKFENNILSSLSDKIKFKVEQLGSKSSQADREKLFTFQVKFDRLFSKFNKLVSDIEDAIETVDGEINKVINSSTDKDVKSLNGKKGALMDLRLILTGTRSLDDYADVYSGSSPSVQSRLGGMSWELNNTTSLPTKTHEMTYEIANGDYNDVLKTFNELMD